MAENDTGWKPSERMLKLMKDKGFEASGVENEGIESVVEPAVHPERGFELVQDQERSGESKVDKIRREQTASDLNLVLAEVSKETRNNSSRNDEYRQSLREAKGRLEEQGIRPDDYLRKDLEINGAEDLKELGRRKAVLRDVVSKMSNGENLNEGETEIANLINLREEDLELVEESVEEEMEDGGEVENLEKTNEPWSLELEDIDKIPNVAFRNDRRTDWVKRNWRNNNIPFDVREKQMEKIYQKSVNTGEVKNETAEKKDEGKKAEVFTEEEEYRIIQECYNLVFERGKNNPDEVKNAILSSSGIIAVDLGRGKDPVISNALVERINKLGIENWANMRNVFAHWAQFKDTEEIKESTLTPGLFISEDAEAFFANKQCELPAKLDAGGRLINGEGGLVTVDLGVEISRAMRELRKHFAEGLLDDRGRPQLVEYWGLVGDLGEKAKLYKSLNLNKYVAETAFALLTSYQMLTDTSAEDFLAMMVNQAKTRVRKYKISEERDPFVRMLIQEDLSNGIKPFTRCSGDELFEKREETERRMAALVSNQLIPTGLSGEGERRLERGDWLKWRVNENLFSSNQLATAKITRDTDNIKPATDQATRLVMMKSALTVLNTMKEIVDPSTDIAKLESLKGKLYRHMTGSFGDAYWLGSNATVPASFAFSNVRQERGRIVVEEAHDMPIQEWISRCMMGVDKAFLYTHSFVDSENPKPVEMKVFAEMAEQLFKNEVQSTKPTFFGMHSEKYREHRKEMLNFIDRLWNQSYDLIDKINRNANPSSYPVWYQQGVSVFDSIKEIAKKADGQIGDWDRRKRHSNLKNL
ncbi:MAG TPA: hypothetical protein VLH94_01130 [Spirochaetia bacterium]|nr:hypothetical protein [Spirochaetia bacterium]